MSKPTSPQKILTQSHLVHSADVVEQSISKVADQINSDFGNNPIVLICVMTGGLFFAGKLLAKLKMPVELDYIQASRYQHDLKGNALQWIKYPSLDLKQKTLLLVDDILDEGITLHEVSHHCLALGAKQVYNVVLVDKANNQSKPTAATYVGLQVPNAFVFGCGMDAYGWWRNLPEIRAL